MKYGTSLDGLSDLTGGIAESIPLRPTSPELSATLGHLLKLTTIVLAKVDDGNRDKSTEINEVPFEYHTVRNLHFIVQKINFDFPRKFSIFCGEKLVKMLWIWTF